MSENCTQNLKDQNTWKRGLYILLFTIIYGVTETIIAFIVLFQFISMLIIHKTNDKLLVFSMNLSTYIYQILSYVTFNSDERPYPFSDFPGGMPETTATASKKKTVKKKASKKKLADKGIDSTISDDSNKTDD